ncbi:MAG TPA: hypothetical protein VG079_07445, partial [Gaiellaceae bacterium]|nr:hypothetical protein [Gaiellaceae bacterium]
MERFEGETPESERAADVGGWAAPTRPYGDVGDRVDRILAAAEEAAERTRAQGEADAAEIRRRTEQEAEQEAETRVRESTAD